MGGWRVERRHQNVRGRKEKTGYSDFWPNGIFTRKEHCRVQGLSLRCPPLLMLNDGFVSEWVKTQAVAQQYEREYRWPLASKHLSSVGEINNPPLPSLTSSHLITPDSPSHMDGEKVWGPESRRKPQVPGSKWSGIHPSHSSLSPHSPVNRGATLRKDFGMILGGTPQPQYLWGGTPMFSCCERNSQNSDTLHSHFVTNSSFLRTLRGSQPTNLCWGTGVGCHTCTCAIPNRAEGTHGPEGSVAHLFLGKQVQPVASVCYSRHWGGPALPSFLLPLTQLPPWIWKKHYFIFPDLAFVASYQLLPFIIYMSMFFE